MSKKLSNLISEIRQCQRCAIHFEHQPKPIIQLSETASILIVGQAPGRKAHHSGIPFDDLSGDRLRQWMGVSKEQFYDASKIAILPMGFCFPGTGKSGDLAPRKECATTWRDQVLQNLPAVQLTLVIGQYAMNWHLDTEQHTNLTDTVKAWQNYYPNLIPLPHPSPRNNRWLAKNLWFAESLLPKLAERVQQELLKTK